MNYFYNLNPIMQAMVATLFTFLVTVLGSGVVFFFKRVNKTIMDAMLGFASGVMISASFFSLLSPAINMSNNLGLNVWLTCTIGFMLGGLLLFFSDKVFNRVLMNNTFFLVIPFIYCL